MAKMSRRRARRTRVRKINSRRVVSAGSTPRRRPGSGGRNPQRTRVANPTVKVAAKRVLASAGRFAKDVARIGAKRTARVGRRLVARGARSAGKGARLVGAAAGAALASVAERVEP